MKRLLVVLLAVIGLCVHPGAALAQSGSARFEVGAQVVVARSGEFDETDLGVGGRVSWNPIGLLGLEGEVTVYPRDYPGDRAFSAGRTEALFGGTLGPRLNRVRPFALFRTGFLTMQRAPRPFACILIYPPPLSCLLAAGQTLTLFDLGGGVELFATPKTFLRVDIGDRIVKYPGPALRGDRSSTTDRAYGHDLRIAAGGGLRF